MLYNAILLITHALGVVTLGSHLWARWFFGVTWNFSDDIFLALHGILVFALDYLLLFLWNKKAVISIKTMYTLRTIERVVFIPQLFIVVFYTIEKVIFDGFPITKAAVEILPFLVVTSCVTAARWWYLNRVVHRTKM